MRSWAVLFCSGLVSSLIPFCEVEAQKLLPGRETPAASTILDNSSYICSDRVLTLVTNYGVYGQDIGNVFGYGHGCFYPFTNIPAIESGVNTTSPLYSAGLWIAGKVNGEIRSTIAAYASEFTPGPVVEDSYSDSALTSLLYRTYRLHSDSAESNPNLDYLAWPREMGAPVNLSGNPVVKGTSALWSVYNDLDGSRHMLTNGSTDPLGIEIQQYVWVTNDSPHEQSVFIRYLLYNQGRETIDSCFVGLFADPDIGGSGDDLFGSNPAAQFAYVYNATDRDMDYGAVSPAVGLQLLKGPLIPYPGVTGFFRQTTIPDMMNLGAYAITALGSHNNLPYPETATETYNLLRGLTTTGSARVNPMTDDTTRFDYEGNPFLEDSWLDLAPGDKLMLVSSGPFTFAPGDSQIVYLRLVIGQSSDHLSSIQNLGVRLRGLPNLTIDPEVAPEDPEDPDDPGGGPDLPATPTLNPNYPNPFNAETHFSYALPFPAHVTVDIINTAGQVVKVLLDDQQAAGTASLTWRADNKRGEEVASGIYLYRLRTGEQTLTRKMVLAR